MKKGSGSHMTYKHVLAAGMCIAALGMTTACGGGAGDAGSGQESAKTAETAQPEQAPSAAQAAPEESASVPETGQQDPSSAAEVPQQEKPAVNETAQTGPEDPDPAAADPQAQPEAAQSVQGKQISLEEAKAAALADAGVSGDVAYTKEKLDYEDGIAVYEVEFFADNAEYEYEINAETGAVYSKSVETHHGHALKTPVHEVAHNLSGSYIDADSAVAAALSHAGFSDTDVTVVKTEFDIDDGRAEYEVEFYSGGQEYEYTINAVDGSVLEYEVD